MRAGGKRALAPALLVSAIFAGGLFRITDPDTPWYLRAGAEILARHALPKVDPFSYTSHQVWLNHEWLSEVLLALAHRAGGFAGVGLFAGALFALTIALLLLAPRDEGCAPLAGLSVVGYLVAAAILREGVSPRAQLFSNLLFAATLVLCLRDARSPDPRGDRALYWAVPIGLLWTQLHGGNPTGVALLGLLFLSRPTVRRALITALAALATCAGPYGFSVHRHFFTLRAVSPAIREWRSLGAALAGGHPVYIVLLLFLIAAAVALGWRARQGERVRFEGLALGLFSLLTVLHVRFSSVTTLVAAVSLAPALARVRIRPALGSACAGATIALVLLGSTRAIGIGLDARHYPVGAVDVLRRTHPPGPLFNSYNFGGYLIFAYPEERVFIDGRAVTVYSPELILELLSVYDSPPRFSALEARYHFRLAVVQRRGRSADLVKWLRAQPDWHERYEGPLAIVFTRDPER